MITTATHTALFTSSISDEYTLPGTIAENQAKETSRFVSEKSIDAKPATFAAASLGGCCIFLVRRTSSDWTHTGFAFDFRADGTFATIEGNTNDEGSREGYEVCRRFRGREGKDFIRLI